jgi:hypothetical protein
MLVATVAAGLFAGAAVYVMVVEHPARVECGQVLAVKEAGVAAWYQGSGVGWLVGRLLLGALIPFTLVVIMPTNRQLHAVRTVVSVAVFVAFAGMSLRS